MGEIKNINTLKDKDTFLEILSVTYPDKGLKTRTPKAKAASTIPI